MGLDLKAINIEWIKIIKSKKEPKLLNKEIKKDS